MAIHKKPQKIDELCRNIRGITKISRFYFFKYDKLSNENKNKVEQIMLDTIEKIK